MSRISLGTPWSELPQGWRWVAWAGAAGIVAAPVVGHAAGDRWRIGPDATLHALGLGLLWLIPYGFLVVFSRDRLSVLGLMLFFGLFLLPCMLEPRARSGCHWGGYRTNMLKQIGTGLALYCDDKGHLPSQSGSGYFLELCRTGHFVAAYLESQEKKKYAWFRGPGPHVDYEVNPAMVGKRDLSFAPGVAPEEIPWVYEKEPTGTGVQLYRLILFADYHVGGLTEDEFQARLKKGIGP